MISLSKYFCRGEVIEVLVWERREDREREREREMKVVSDWDNMPVSGSEKYSTIKKNWEKEGWKEERRRKGREADGRKNVGGKEETGWIWLFLLVLCQPNQTNIIYFNSIATRAHDSGRVRELDPYCYPYDTRSESHIHNLGGTRFARAL